MAEQGSEHAAAHWLAEAGQEITRADDWRAQRAVERQIERDEAERSAAERRELAARGAGCALDEDARHIAAAINALWAPVPTGFKAGQ